MKIVKDSIAGTLESCDIQVILTAGEEPGIKIELKSSVEKQFGRQIRNVIQETLEHFGVDQVRVVATDKGALDCTIRARVECALYRACENGEKLDWTVIS